MKRRDAIRRALGVGAGLSIVSLSGRLAPEDGSASSDPDASIDGATLDEAALEDTAIDGAALEDAAIDEAAPEGASALGDGSGGALGDDTYEEVTEQLRRTHEERCQCPACGGSMPGRG